MKKFELIVGFLAILGICLKFVHLPGSSYLTVFSFMTLSMFYSAFSFALFNSIKLRNIFVKSSYKDTNAKRIIGAVGLGLALSTTITGGLFKLQFWPGANMQLLAGLVVMGIILLIATFFYFRNKADYYKRIFKRIAIYGGLGLVLYLTPSSTLADIYYRNNPEYAEIFKKVLDDPYNMELQKQLDEMYRITFHHQKLKNASDKEELDENGE